MFFIILISLLGYIIGSINSAVIISKKAYNSDIRDYGSKNAGATNMFRIFGKKAGAIVFIFDFLKGLIAVGIARFIIAFFDAPYECMLFAGFFAQLGHTFPLFFRFRGGKGVATAVGAAFGIMPLVAGILLFIFAVILSIAKTVSIASCVCAVAYPLLAYFLISLFHVRL